MPGSCGEFPVSAGPRGGHVMSSGLCVRPSGSRGLAAGRGAEARSPSKREHACRPFSSSAPLSV